MFRQRKHLAVQAGSFVGNPIPTLKTRIHGPNLRKCDIFPAMSDYLRFFILLAAGWINRDQQKIIDYQCPLALKRSGYTRSSAKAIGSDSLISRGVGWASRRKHSDGKPSSNSLELSPQIRFYAGSGPSLPENTTGLPNEGPEGQECAIRLPIKSSRWQTITRRRPVPKLSRMVSPVRRFYRKGLPL